MSKRIELKVTNDTDDAVDAKVWRDGSIIKNGILTLSPNEEGSVKLREDVKYSLDAYYAGAKHNRQAKHEFTAGSEDLTGTVTTTSAGSLDISVD